jgi:hypothetical protein
VNQGDTVTVTLRDTLPENVSMIFPGQSGVAATGGDADGLMAREAAPGGTPVTYSFVASRPGTYLYQSGTHVELQVEMGLVGALIVRPAGFDQASNRTAYGDPGTGYVHEYLYFLTEMDPDFHRRVEMGFTGTIDNTIAHPVLWFINGRNAPDDLEPAFIPWHAASALHRDHTHAPGRAGPATPRRRWPADASLSPPRQQHAADRSRRPTAPERPGVGPDLAVSNFTVQTHPEGRTTRCFSWTGERLGWDVYAASRQPARLRRRRTATVSTIRPTSGATITTRRSR